MSVSVTFAYSGTFKGKPVSGTVSAMPVSHSQVASVVYAEIIGKAGATLNRRRNDWDCGTTGEGKATLFRTFDASGKLEMRVEITRQAKPEPVVVERTPAAIYADWLAAETEWMAQIKAAFPGKRAGDVRYQKEGEGEPGTALRAAYDAWRRFGDEYRQAPGVTAHIRATT
jgi:hypothetical protein